MTLRRSVEFATRIESENGMIDGLAIISGHVPSLYSNREPS